MQGIKPCTDIIGRAELTMKEVYYINGKTYILRFYNGTHRVECEGRIAFEGWYEKCKAFLEDLEIFELESRF